MFEIVLFNKGDFIEVHPGTDRWMMGDRFATVLKRGRKLLTVRFERSGKTAKLHPGNVYAMIIDGEKVYA